MKESAVMLCKSQNTSKFSLNNTLIDLYYYWSLAHIIPYSYCTWAVVAQWIKPQTLKHEVDGSNLVALVAVMPFGKGTLYSLSSPLQKNLKPLVPWLLAYKQPCFPSSQLEINPTWYNLDESPLWLVVHWSLIFS